MTSKCTLRGNQTTLTECHLFNWLCTALCLPLKQLHLPLREKASIKICGTISAQLSPIPAKLKPLGAAFPAPFFSEHYSAVPWLRTGAIPTQDFRLLLKRPFHSDLSLSPITSSSNFTQSCQQQERQDRHTGRQNPLKQTGSSREMEAVMEQ